MHAILQVGVILLAAGASRRMGKPKMLLPWGSRSVLGHLVWQWQELGARQIAVVHAKDDGAILQELDRLKFPPQNRIPNPCPDRGMFSSIQCAAAWAGWEPGLSHWAIVLGDQPHLQASTLRAWLEFAASNPEKICQPARSGRPRHPVVLPFAVFHRLPTTDAKTFKDFLQARPVSAAFCELDDPGLDVDIDNPADYQSIWTSFFPKP